MADDRLQKQTIKLTEAAWLAGKQYQEGDTVEVYGFEADRFVFEGWAEKSKSKKS